MDGSLSKARWVVNSAPVSCAACGRAWKMVVGNSVYERQALESKPCPHCGSCTLICAEKRNEVPRRFILSYRRAAAAKARCDRSAA